jgi:hypothetical protein
MKRLLVLMAAVLALAAPPAEAQRDQMQMGEALGGKVTRGAPAAATTPEFAVELNANSKGVLKAKAAGDLRVSKLPPHVRTALGFLARWGRGPAAVTVSSLASPDTPVTVNGARYVLRDVVLVPPVIGLSTVRTDGAITGVRVSAMTVRTKDGETKGAGVLTLRAKPRGGFEVVGVTITNR